MDTALSPKIGGNKLALVWPSASCGCEFHPLSARWQRCSTAAPPLLKVFISVRNWSSFRCQTFHHGCYIAKLQLFGNHSCWKNSQLLPWVFVLKEYQDFLHHACSLSAPFPSSHTSSYGGIVNARTTHVPCPLSPTILQPHPPSDSRVGQHACHKHFGWF